MGCVLNTYAAYFRDTDIRLQSSSGAMFSAISEYILSLHGVIYGVAMSEDCYQAEYVRVTERNELGRIRGSKYVQAKIGDTFQKVKSDLENGKAVLFTGTGCQVNGLKCFLGKEYNTLYCLDVICYGTPSPKLWREYVKYRESQCHAKILSVNFRSKDRNGWDGFEMKEVDGNGTETYISRHEDLYFQLFVKNICLRPSCYKCEAKNIKRSDLTVGDFWGIEDVRPELNDDRGISLVITRTERGQQLFNKIKDKLIFQKVSYEEGVRNNKAEYEPYRKPAKRERFFRDMRKMPFEKLGRKYTAVSVRTKIKRIVKRLLRLD